MPDLAMPIFNAELVTSLYGNMCFPASFAKAGITASWMLDGALQSATGEQIEMIGSDRVWSVRNLARGYTKIVKEAESAFFRGSQCGGAKPTWEDAKRAAEITASEAHLSGVRTSFIGAKAEFWRVFLPGNPSTLIACQPVKNAGRDNLIPYGGGAIINELDGNFTLWSEDGKIEFGWTKIRGPEPKQQFFRIEQLGSPNILDTKGRTPLLPVIRAITVEAAEQKEKAAEDVTIELLRAIYAEPRGSQQDWTMAKGRGARRGAARQMETHGKGETSLAARAR